MRFIAKISSYEDLIASFEVIERIKRVGHKDTRKTAQYNLGYNISMDVDSNPTTQNLAQELPHIQKYIKIIENPVAAGFPSPAADYVENELDFNALLVRNPSTTFCLKVKGESMSGAGINSNDIVVVDKLLTPNTNDIVVASIDGDFTLKRLIQEQGKLLLRAENELYDDIEIQGSMELVIFGVVSAVVKLLK